MTINTENQTIEQIQNLKPFLPDKTQEELDKILAYGEKIKKEGVRKKKEWWIKYSREDFKKLLLYNQKYRDELEGKYEFLDKMAGVEREKFIEEYLYDDMLYSGKFDEIEIQEKTYYYYNAWAKGNFLMEEGMTLDLSCILISADSVEAIVEKIKLKKGMTLLLHTNEIGDEGAKIIAEKIELKEGAGLSLEVNGIGSKGAKAISCMELKEGVSLDVGWNQIGDGGARYISKMKLKEGVDLELASNEIGDEGVKAIAENMELKEGVVLGLSYNEIGDVGVLAIMEKMELKEGVSLNLKGNKKISDKMKQKLKDWEKSYIDRGILCNVLVYDAE